MCILQNSFYLYFSMVAVSGISQCPCCPTRFVLLHAVTRSCFLSQSIDDDDDDDDDVDDDSIFVLNIF